MARARRPVAPAALLVLVVGAAALLTTSLRAATARSTDTAGPVVARLVDALDDAVRTSHLDPASSAADVLTTTLGDVLAGDDARAALATLGADIDAAARATADVGVDEVRVEQDGAPRAAGRTDDHVTVEVDVRTERHLVRDDVAWVEVVPHRVTVDADGRLVDVVALDLGHRDGGRSAAG